MEVLDREQSILPKPYTWIDSRSLGGPVVLRFNCSAVAVIRPDDRGVSILIHTSKNHTLYARDRSVRRACYGVERWFDARTRPAGSAYRNTHGHHKPWF
ncbi:hypothetical protein [Lysobacter sp. Hz 25]|uniref:hypothetical protein n=1 Tax=Lysobacter sp. Hz 25 TaxID=3383698 RepID=UPI0038D4E430